jgi:hypothetical protein
MAIEQRQAVAIFKAIFDWHRARSCDGKEALRHFPDRRMIGAKQNQLQSRGKNGRGKQNVAISAGEDLSDHSAPLAC